MSYLNLTTTYAPAIQMPPSPTLTQAVIQYPSPPQTVDELDDARKAQGAYWKDRLDNEDYSIFDVLEFCREELRRWAEDIRKEMNSNVKDAWNESMSSSSCAFPQFSQLPIELRLRVRQYCLRVPRIVELGRCFNTRPNTDSVQPFQYGNRPVPPLLHTCAESRSEAKAFYHGSECYVKSSSEDTTPYVNRTRFSNNFVRYDYDIIHLRNLDFSKDAAGYANPSFVPHQVLDEEDEPDEDDEDEDDSIYDRWKGRPSMFEHVRILCLSRETMIPYWDSSLIHHFFPRLLLLVILIDDNIVINPPSAKDFLATPCLYDPETHYYLVKHNVYEMNFHKRPRSLFPRTCTGPFTEPVSNTKYAK